MCHAQEKKQVSYYDQQWFQYTYLLKLNDQWKWHADGGYRFQDAFEESFLHIFQTSLTYKLFDDIFFSLGFTHLGLYRNDELYKVEFRPYQILTINQKFPFMKVQQKLRFEQRYFRLVEDGEIQSEDDFFLRLRYKLNFSYPISHISDNTYLKKMSLSLGNEVFFAFGDDIVYNVLERNRFLTGAAYKFTPAFSLTVLHNWEFKSVNAPAQSKVGNVVWVILKTSM